MYKIRFLKMLVKKKNCPLFERTSPFSYNEVNKKADVWRPQGEPDGWDWTSCSNP